MNKGPDSAAVGRAPERKPEPKDDFVSRKLIRPTLPARAENEPRTEREPRAERSDRTDRPERAARRAIGEQTHAENFYFQKQMQSKTLMTVVLKNGEEIQGMIEWYDRCCIKFSRAGKPNLLVYKPGIRYMYKTNEGDGR